MRNWFRRHKRSPHPLIESARADHERTSELLAKIDAQTPEVEALVDRLETRRHRNHFAEGLYIAMGVSKESR
jgi:hypothetical protein